MDRLTSEQRQKVNELKQGKFYKFEQPGNDRILIGEFNVLDHTGGQTYIWFRQPCAQILKPACEIIRGGVYGRSVEMIDYITPLDIVRPEGAPPTWQISDADLLALAGCPAGHAGGRRRKTRRSKRTKKALKRGGSRRK